MYRILIVALIVILTAACAGPVANPDALTGSGDLVTRQFDLDGFRQVETNTAAQVEVTRGDAFAVEVDVDDNLESYLDVQVTGDTLRVALKNGSYTGITLRARVTMPELVGIDMNGGSGLQGALAGEDVTIDLNGGSRVTLTGTAGTVTIDTNGGSQAHLGQLAAQDVTLVTDGASQLEVNASGTISGRAGGGSVVTVVGAPTAVDVETRGGATLNEP